MGLELRKIRVDNVNTEVICVQVAIKLLTKENTTNSPHVGPWKTRGTMSAPAT